MESVLVRLPVLVPVCSVEKVPFFEGDPVELPGKDWDEVAEIKVEPVFVSEIVGFCDSLPDPVEVKDTAPEGVGGADSLSDTVREGDLVTDIEEVGEGEEDDDVEGIPEREGVSVLNEDRVLLGRKSVRETVLDTVRLGVGDDARVPEREVERVRVEVIVGVGDGKEEGLARFGELVPPPLGSPKEIFVPERVAVCDIESEGEPEGVKKSGVGEIE